MPNTEPLITVAIPTRNRVEGFKKALASVLRQSYSNIEIIVSDNASQVPVEPLAKALNDHRVKVFRHDDPLSMVDNWNCCLERASGEFFLLLSDDDEIFPGAVQGLVSQLLGTGAAFAYGRAVFALGNGTKSGVSLAAPEFETGRDFIHYTFQKKRQALPSFTLFPTSAARALRGYPETGSSTDLALRLALAASGSVASLQEPVGIYLIHPGGMTWDPDKTIESFELFRNWCAAADSPLSEWQAEAKAYCGSALREMARGYALRGEAGHCARFISKAAEISGPRLADKIVPLILLNPVVRWAALLRRQLAGGVK